MSIHNKNLSLVISLLLLISHYLIAQNVTISNKNNPNEPSIMLNPKNPSQMIAASNLNNYFISIDTGRTWTIHKLTSSYGVYGDPVISVDTSENFYFFHLSNPADGNWIDRIVCQKTTDHGQTWSDGSYTGLNGKKAQDKHWCAIDRTNNNMYLTWTQFDEYGSVDLTKKSNILFSKSTDSGITWTTPIKINYVDGDCIDSDNTMEGAVPAVGPDGQIYVAWAGPNGIVFNKSIDEGNTWLKEEVKIDPMPNGWDYTIPGIYRANGLPVTACDLSTSPYNGTIYVNWTDQRNGNNDTDVWLSKSSDQGATWSAPIRVNDDPSGNHQFLTWMTIDQSTGNLYFIFYDRRNHANDATDVYMAISNDGGQSFINRKISESPFIPNENIFFGDYTNIVAHNNIIRPIWTRLHNGQLSILTDITPINKIVTTTEVSNIKNENPVFTNYPNPSANTTYVSFKLKKNTKVNLEISDLNGRILYSVIKNEIRPIGAYIEPIDLTSLHLSNGIYIIKLSLDDKVKKEKQVIIK